MVAGQLNYAAIIQTRKLHETKACAAAIRQKGRMPTKTNEWNDNYVESRQEFRRRLVQEVAALLPRDAAHESMSGVTRQVRHMGMPLVQNPSGARATNKATLLNVAAQV
jgi:hypothetical protein